MRKHLKDNGDINVAIDDEGNVIFVCSTCGCKWFDKITPAFLTPQVTKNQFVRLLAANQEIVQNFKIDMGKFS